MKIKNVKIYGLDESIIRSGYPMQVGEPVDLPDTKNIHEVINLDNDLTRAKKLAKTKSGSGHDNFLKGIIVQFDLQYPEYFSPQFQRYNWLEIVSSQSKMHKITSKELTRNDFTLGTDASSIRMINNYVEEYNKAKKEDKEQWFKYIISNLPLGYLKWMGISTNYLQLKTVYRQRKNHKLEEWRYFCNWIESLPLSKKLITTY